MVSTQDDDQKACFYDELLMALLGHTGDLQSFQIETV